MKCNERTLWVAGFNWDGELVVGTVTCSIATRRARVIELSDDSIRHFVGFSSQLSIGSDGYWRGARGGVIRGNRNEALTELAKRLDEAHESLRDELSCNQKHKAAVLKALK